MKLVLSAINAAPISLWYQVVHEAEASCAIVLQEELESYLVFLLMRFMKRPEITSHIMAMEFLSGFKLASYQKQMVLQEVGDKCLIYSGLFPKNVERKLVKLSYFIQLGQTAYSTISQANDDVYSLLAKEFVPLMDILQSVRDCSNGNPDLLPLEAYDLWNQTGSQRAFSILRKYSASIPLATDFKEKLIK